MAKPAFNYRRVLLVHAHPDDESLSTGHVIADRIAAGAEVMVLTLTRGERGKMKLVELKSLEGNLAAMGAFRTNELINALKEFGTPELKVQHRFAGTRAYLDSGMRINAFGKPGKPKDLDEMALSAVTPSVIADEVIKAIKDFHPEAVVTYNRNGGFGHPDHKAAFEGTALALRKVAKANNGRAPKFWVVAEPGERFDITVGNEATTAVRKAALNAHASQISLNSETYSLSPTKELRYDAPDRLRLIRRPSAWLPARKVLMGLWGLPLGVLLALAGTMLHRIHTSGVEQTPIGLIVALIMTGSLGLGLRLLRSSLGALYLMTLGFFASIWYFANGRPGSPLIGGDALGNWWSFGSMVLLAAIILFPRLRPKTWSKNASGHR
jgi:N-acetyl-1-D-myo-inositol-2-amino-2-deoxy-alpha-D-glucopyranoside deacetylase